MARATRARRRASPGAPAAAIHSRAARRAVATGGGGAPPSGGGLTARCSAPHPDAAADPSLSVTPNRAEPRLGDAAAAPALVSPRCRTAVERARLRGRRRVAVGPRCRTARRARLGDRGGAAVLDLPLTLCSSSKRFAARSPSSPPARRARGVADPPVLRRRRGRAEREADGRDELADRDRADQRPPRRPPVGQAARALLLLRQRGLRAEGALDRRGLPSGLAMYCPTGRPSRGGPRARGGGNEAIFLQAAWRSCWVVTRSNKSGDGRRPPLKRIRDGVSAAARVGGRRLSRSTSRARASPPARRARPRAARGRGARARAPSRGGRRRRARARRGRAPRARRRALPRRARLHDPAHVPAAHDRRAAAAGLARLCARTRAAPRAASPFRPPPHPPPLARARAPERAAPCFRARARVAPGSRPAQMRSS